MKWFILLISFLQLEFVLTTETLSVIDITKSTLQVQIATQVCSGLFNRENTVSGAVYTISDEVDTFWLKQLTDVDIHLIDDISFIKNCLNSTLIAGYLKYNYTEHKLIIPQLLTIAAVTNTIPIDITSFSPELTKNIPLKFDTARIFERPSLYDATLYLFQNYMNQTTGMAKMDPGFDIHNHPIEPPLVGCIRHYLIDFIVKERLFNFYLYYGCIAGTKEHKLVESIVNNNPWIKPINVFGYDDTFGVLGDLFEAETNCVKEHNMGQIASSGVSNMAYFSNKPRITSPLKQNTDPELEYNSSNKYIAFIIGDGDNIAMVKDDRRKWMVERVAKCGNGRPKCYPLVWTLSPQLLKLGPDIIEWFYNMSYMTGTDYFVLPPSGDLYSYPAMMSNDIQTKFVENTEMDCRLMSTNTIVDWEWFGTWEKTFKSYYPKYENNGIVQGFLTVNVPFIFPIFAFKKNEYFKMIGDIAVFKQREWRGTGNSSIPFSKEMYLTVDKMANEINHYPNNTITYIYLTSDGGGNPQMFDDLVTKLDNNIKVVNHNLLVKFANLASHY